MYILFEYGAILGLIAVAAGLLFAFSAALMGLAEWFLRRCNARTTTTVVEHNPAAERAVGLGGCLGVLHR